MIKLRLIKKLSCDLIGNSVYVYVRALISDSFYDSTWPEVWNLSDVSVCYFVQHLIRDEIND